MLKSLFGHDLFQERAPFCLQRQRVIALQFLVEWRDFLVQEDGWKIIEAIGCVRITKRDDEWPVEVRLAEDFKLVGALVPLKVWSVRLLVKDVQTKFSVGAGPRHVYFPRDLGAIYFEIGQARAKDRLP